MVGNWLPQPVQATISQRFISSERSSLDAFPPPHAVALSLYGYRGLYRVLFARALGSVTPANSESSIWAAVCVFSVNDSTLGYGNVRPVFIAHRQHRKVAHAPFHDPRLAVVDGGGGA